MKFQQPTQQTVQRKETPQGEQGGAAPAAPGADHASLRTMNYQQGAAAVSPFQAKAAPSGGGPVQFKLVPGATVEKMDAATLDDMIDALRPTAAWPEVVALYKDMTASGTKPLDPSSRDDLTLELLIHIESAFKFGGEVSIDTLWDDAALVTRMIGHVEKAAAPAEEPETPSEPEPEPVVLPKPGTYGMVTEDTTVLAEDGSEIALSEGEAIEALRGHEGQLVVKVHTGAAVKVGRIDPKVFKAQPKLTVDEDTGKTDDYSYQEYVGELFLARDGVEGPSVMDVDQGSLGDCYLIAAMGAVAASNPDIIRDMIDYDASTGQYTVTFQELQRNGRFKPHSEVVDNYLPTRRGGRNRTAYALSDSAFDADNQALWPAIIEKAYAQWQGGYHVLDEGGSSARAMQLFTGVRSVRESMPSADDVAAMFAGWQAENKAVVCGSRDWIDQRSVTGLIEGSGEGPYTGELTDKDGAGAEVMKNTVKIRDSAAGSSRIRDDGKGELTGAGLESGSISYEGGGVRFEYKEGQAPPSADTLEATYRYEGTLSSSLNLHGNHAYIFREVKDGLLYFHNPWGPAARKHPKPMTGAQFRDFFETVGVNSTIPQQNR